jgi:hypothetical protein
MERRVEHTPEKTEAADRLSEAIMAIDTANADDPNTESDNGIARPAALLYGKRMSSALEKLYPDAGELLKLAARAQHIRRWTIARSGYPMDRQGYLQWRNTLKHMHADLTGEIMERCAYPPPAIARVKSLLRKEHLKRDPETQAIEDAACIVFLGYYFEEFAAKHDDRKIIAILRKTWIKMSETGRRAALALPLSPKAQALIEAALDPQAVDNAGKAHLSE